ncbi:glycosyltransferase [Paraburkholderia hospita]|jgi:glycosyltransferase involved in cell wall biosynthesis|uniref:Glycosyl transferase family protein n=1 Tax=Paraburkholderia hospita TaxID=169430 RepID=A0ABN0FCW2_9BURK|nr:glycosyltransferase [Paraburkholderia hospita]EUC14776.1 glycosyl transferase family 2 [Burkholderia sp. BT03]AXE99322.1 glycosyl transferase [Paraburkholderia hospita]EIM96437.1 glycosyl transferase family protein [Paraburkholderia hospita]OUL82367.1 glycosyl transferase [Paraburkholderia hospita]OUL93502.1 glycosyl transferase [Paraburkholderia hospita]
MTSSSFTPPVGTAPLDDVAVLMPAYNGQADVERTLASFSEDARIHVLIVDDGSTPPIVAPALPNMSIDVLRMPKNGGIERALQAGIEALAARGFRYAARIDAGDLTVPQRLARQRAYLEAHPQVAGLGMWTQVVSRDGQPLFMLTPPSEPRAIRRVRFMRACFVHPSMMLRIDAVLAAGNYREAYKAAEDLDLFLRLMERYDCANLPELGLYYELNEGGISATKRRRQIVSTLRLQMRYFNVLNPYDWLGLAKNLLHFVTPYQTLQRVKKRLYAPRASL